MDYSSLHEDKKRGTFDFPIELYYVDRSSPRYRMPIHWHLEYELILILDGLFHLTLDGKKYTLSRGDSVWISDGVAHGGEPENCVYECVVFDLETMLKSTPICTKPTSEILLNSSFLTGPIIKNSPEAFISDKIFEAMEKEQKGYELITIGLLWQLMGVLLKQSEKTNAAAPQSKNQVTRLKPVLSYIRDNYGACVTLDILAQIAGMTPRYFCRAFSHMTGKTPMAYLNYYRIEIAGERLRLTDDTITEIAFSCGFNDISYFTKQFKKHKGVTPSRYRKQEIK